MFRTDRIKKSGGFVSIRTLFSGVTSCAREAFRTGGTPVTPTNRKSTGFLQPLVDRILRDFEPNEPAVAIISSESRRRGKRHTRRCYYRVARPASGVAEARDPGQEILGIESEGEPSDFSSSTHHNH